MPLYSYTAKNENGERLSGTIDADDLTSAKEALKQQNLKSEELFQISYESSASTEFEPSDGPVVDEELIETQEKPSDLPLTKEPPAIQETTPPPHPTTHEPIEIDPPKKQVPPHDWTVEEEPSSPKIYFPIVDTLRLYAGWLLAWYALVYGLGSYQSSRTLPFEIPYLMGIYYSPLVLSFTLGAFLFLLFTNLYRLAGRGIFLGILFSALAVACFVIYRMNV